MTLQIPIKWNNSDFAITDGLHIFKNVNMTKLSFLRVTKTSKTQQDPFLLFSKKNFKKFLRTPHK